MIKLFKNKVFYNFITWFSILAIIPFAISTFIFYDDGFTIFSTIMRIIVALLHVVLFFSFKKHDMNIVHLSIGAILSVYLLGSLLYLVFVPAVLVSTIVIFIITLLFFISVIIINSNKKSKPYMVIASQILSILFALTTIVSLLVSLEYCVNIVDYIVCILVAISSPLGVFSICCVEARMDAYNFKRENK